MQTSAEHAAAQTDTDPVDPAEMADQPDRPEWACLLHRPPGPDRSWCPAADGLRVCEGCLGRLRETLADVVKRYRVLDARLSPTLGGQTGGGRGAPGFGSRSPGSDHVIAMRDPASRPSAVARDDVQYLWDPFSLDGHEPLPAGVAGPQRAGNFTARRDVWRGADGRAHVESDRPVRSVPGTLAGLAELVAEMRDFDMASIAPPRPEAPRWPQCRLTWTLGRPYRARIMTPVEHYGGWLDTQLDWLAAQDWVADVAAQLREVLADLRPVTGDPAPKFIGLCPGLLPEPDGDGLPVVCRTRLYAPPRGDEVRCRSFPADHMWPRDEWLALGRELHAQASVA